MNAQYSISKFLFLAYAMTNPRDHGSGGAGGLAKSSIRIGEVTLHGGVDTHTAGSPHIGIFFIHWNPTD